MKKDNNFGMLTTFIGGTLWGINGVMGSFLFLNKNVTTAWLIPYRLMLAGLLLLGYLYYKKGSKVFDILKNPKDLLQIILFGLIPSSFACSTRKLYAASQSFTGAGYVIP